MRLYPDNVDNKVEIFIRDNNGEIVSIGSYKTKKRALKILDEIQNIFVPKGIIKVNSILKLSDKEKIKEYYENKFYISDKMVDIKPLPETYIYEMPKE